MYHALVKRIARKNFERVNQKDFDSILNECAPNVRHRFGGDHALGGERRDREALGQWFGRLGRLTKSLNLAVEDIWVKGLPHDTTIFIRWTATDPQPLNPGYRNRGVHIIKMKWGRVVDIDAHEDSQAIAEHLVKLSAGGVTEAQALPIVS